MTALGKTLVFFVLLFSLVTGGLIVMVFLTRTNWRNAYENMTAERKVANDALRAEQETFKARRETYEAKIKELGDTIAAKDVQLGGLQAQLKDKDTQIAAQESKARTEEANSKAATVEIDKLKNERDQMVATLTDRNTRLVKLEKDIVGFRDRAVQAEINYNQSTAKNERLALLVEDQKRQLDEFKQRGIQPNPGGPRAPAAEVQGKVLEVSGSFATINLGRNHELKEGDVLQVYRLSPSAQYLGTLKIQRADVNQSVGVFTPAVRNASIMKGDTVDTKVLGR
ncbi:MAG: hypothetical protein ACJ8F7_01055 [Gemmataceae bacterium]